MDATQRWDYRAVNCEWCFALMAPCAEHDCALCQHDADMHAHFTNRPFRWARPKLTVYVPADKRPVRAMWNRYPHNIIGAAVVIFGRCWGVTWKR